MIGSLLREVNGAGRAGRSGGGERGIDPIDDHLGTDAEAVSLCDDNSRTWVIRKALEISIDLDRLVESGVKQSKPQSAVASER